MESNFLNSVLENYRANNWIKILNLNKNSDNLIAQKLLWVWPSVTNLKFIRDNLIKHKVQGITSLGCGNGLLEWIISKYTMFPVIGYEINQEWWTSKYAIPQFIKLEFAEIPPTKKMLKSNYALLFCYFNDGEAFMEYMKLYEGSLVIIIGPGEGCGRHTDPQPFNANFGENSLWKLSDYQEIKETKDFIAVFVKR